MSRVARPPRPVLRWVLMAAVAALWSSSLFELGLYIFVERFGVTFFVATGMAVLGLGLMAVLLRRVRMERDDFFAHHRTLVAWYVLYWAVSWAGVLYSPNLYGGFTVCAQYVWYTVLAVVSLMILRSMPVASRRSVFFLAGGSAFVFLLALSLHSAVTGETTSLALRQTGRYSLGAFKDYNVFTFSLLVAVQLSFLKARESHSRPTLPAFLIYLLLVVLAVTMGVLSGSRRSVVMYGPLSLLVPFVLLTVRSLGGFTRGVALVAVVAGAIFMSTQDGVLARLSPALATPGHLDQRVVMDTQLRLRRGLGFITGDFADTELRESRWRAAGAVASRFGPVQVLFGGGTRSYFVQPEFIWANGDRSSPHNFLLAAYLEGGLLKLVLVLGFFVTWTACVLREARRQGFWTANFLVLATLLWYASVMISGEEFFTSKQFLLIFLVYGALWSRRTARATVPRPSPAAAPVRAPLLQPRRVRLPITFAPVDPA